MESDERGKPEYYQAEYYFIVGLHCSHVILLPACLMESRSSELACYTADGWGVGGETTIPSLLLTIYTRVPIAC